MLKCISGIFSSPEKGKALMSILGFDPGGINNFGVACISSAGDGRCLTVSSAQEAFDAFDVEPIGVGVDAPLWWSTMPGGGRECDQWIRKMYKIPSGSVQSINSLRGAAIAQGLLVSDMISKRFPKCAISADNISN
jgi:predicted nuclease with RNAse H fold